MLILIQTHLGISCQKKTKPVDGDDWLASLQSIHYADGNFSCVELHGEIAALNQWGLDKSGSYVSDMDIAYVPDTRQLAQAFEIMAGESL